ncbi:MAG TPA: cadmium-translocating P-type ATPase [Candidatus Aminicenantes bacterium]|nr:cadmium-translocating P-type ATPase [Candidatus Aminicenantes bacterium]
MVADFRRRFWISLAATVPILALSPMIQRFLGLGDALRFPGDIWLLFALSSFVYAFGGYPFLKGIAAELGKRRPGMMTLIAVAITTAYAYSAAVVFGLRGEVFFWELATLVDIMLLGHWVEMKSVAGASRALEELARLMPSEAHLLREDGSTVDVPLSELEAGRRVVVKPGEKVPADGDVVEGETSVDEAMLTGESKPVSKKEGDTVIGGSVNGEGSLTVEIKRTGKDSYLSQVVDLVRRAQASKSRTQDLSDRAAMWLTLIAIGAGLLTLIGWLAAAERGFSFALERMVTVMVITCPHALGLAVPLVVAMSTAISARNGLLIRDRAAFERARKIQAVVFDKTGTLTEGRFGVTDTLALGSGGLDEAGVLRYAAAVESRSEHSIAKGITAAAPGDLPPVEGFKAIPGQGAEGRVEGREIKIVSPGYLEERGIGIDDERAERLSAEGKTVVYLLIDGRPAGALALADIVRPESKAAVGRLKEMGVQCLMLTGDNRAVAEQVAAELGLDDFFAEVLPRDKAAKIKEVQDRGLVVAMVGDGVNDAPALAQADVGIAIGAGTDVAVEAADIVLVRSDPLDAVAIVGLARATYRKMVQNLAWATGYNAVAIPLAAGVLFQAGIVLSPALGAVLMSLSTVIVAVNARLLKVGEAKGDGL